MSDPTFQEPDQVQGISEEDQREIMLEIEKVAGENRITVSEGLFDFSARRNGALFPLLVNMAGVVLLAGGIAALLWVFRTGEQQLLERGRTVVTAESRLIEEIRRETEEQLAAKDGEITAIQTRLQEIDAERAALAGDIESRIARREAELRRELDAELEAERRRLQALNLSEAEIEARLASFAEVKEREFSQRMDQFQRQAEAEQNRLAEELNQREAEFTRSLTQASQEREALLRESSERLTALQQEYEAELAEGRAQLDVAEAELNRLAREQERELLLRGQIRGLYQTAAGALRQGNHEVASARLRDLRALLNEESVLRVPALREQRPVDLILIESLESLIRLDRQFGTPQAERDLARGALVTRVDEMVDDAARALQEGRTEDAVSLYRSALEVIPAVSESYGFLGTADDDAATQELTRTNEAAAQLIATAEEAREAGDLGASMGAYAAVALDHPRSRYRADAVRGMEETLRIVQTRSIALQDALADSVAELEAERSALAETLETTTEDRDAARAELVRRETETADLRATIATLETQVPAATAELSAARAALARAEEDRTRVLERVARLEGSLATRTAELEATEEELLEVLNELATARATTDTASAPDPELLAELEDLRTLDQEIRAASALWEGYREDAARLDEEPDADDVRLLEMRVSLERFMSDATMQEFFPDLSREVERFDAAFVASGRENALLDATDLLLDITFAEDSSERIDLVRDARSGADPAYLEFLTELEDLLQSLE